MIRRLLLTQLKTLLHKNKSVCCGCRVDRNLSSSCHANSSSEAKPKLGPSKEVYAENFKFFLKCSYKEAANIIEQCPEISKRSLLEINKQIVKLTEKNISARNIVISPWLLNETSDGKRQSNVFRTINLIGIILEKLDELINDVRKLDPSRDFNDFVPLATVTKENLEKLVPIFQRDKKIIPEGNRIHHFSKRLDIEPIVVSHQFASHLFILFAGWNNIEKDLNVMLEFDISPQNILNCLWAFRYKPEFVKCRLEAAKKAGKEDIKLWLISCSERDLNRTLGGKGDVIEYLSSRLGYSIEQTEMVVQKSKAVENARIPRIKEILDFLMVEEKYEPYEIANSIGILMRSLKTTRSRVEMFKKHGLRPSVGILRGSEKIYNGSFKTLVELQTKAATSKASWWVK